MPTWESSLRMFQRGVVACFFTGHLNVCSNVRNRDVCTFGMYICVYAYIFDFTSKHLNNLKS